MEHAGRVLQRAVVHGVARVVGGSRRLAHLEGADDVLLGGGERDGVEAVQGASAPLAGGGGIGQGVLESREVVVTHVLEFDEWLDLLELDGQAHRVAK